MNTFRCANLPHCKILTGACLVLVLLAVFENALVFFVNERLSHGVLFVHQQGQLINPRENEGISVVDARVLVYVTARNSSNSGRRNAAMSPNLSSVRHQQHDPTSPTGLQATPTIPVHLDPDIFDKRLDIMELLKTWKKLDKPFFDNNTPTLKLPFTDLPEYR